MARLQRLLLCTALAFALLSRATLCQEWLEIREIIPADNAPVDMFGSSMAIDGDRLVVGAWRDDELLLGDAGSVTLFERNYGGPGQWSEVVKLFAPDSQPGWTLGFKVAVAGDVIVGAAVEADNLEGAAYVFEPDASGRWQATAKLKAWDGLSSVWGSDVATSEEQVFVGYEGDSEAGPSLAGAVYVFSRDPVSGAWVPDAKLFSEQPGVDARFGDAVAVDGDVLVIGARRDSTAASLAGAAHIYERDGSGQWLEMVKLLASDATAFDGFGGAVAVDGDFIVIGAHRDDELGNSSGSAYVFERGLGGEWTEIQKLLASDGEIGALFGASVAIFDDTVAIGASSADSDKIGSVGATYVFGRDGQGPWIESQQIMLQEPASNDNFGVSVALLDATLFVGADLRDASGFDSGAAYQFERRRLALATEGSCPGTVTVSLSGATPNAPVALVSGTSLGQADIPVGPCTGALLDLEEPTLLTLRRTDDAGKTQATRGVGQPACGRLLQAIDLATCITSPVATLP